MPSLVLGSALAFFSGARSTNSVCRLLQGTGPLPRVGRLALRSCLCVNSAGYSSMPHRLQTSRGLYRSGGNTARQSPRPWLSKPPSGKRYNLELSFALQNKDYRGRAKVLIKNGNGKDVLKTFSDDPLFFAKLPQGTYTVEATALGQAQEQIVHSNTTQIQQATKPHSPHIVAPLIAYNTVSAITHRVY